MYERAYYCGGYMYIRASRMINDRSILLFRMQIECIAEPIEGMRVYVQQVGKDKKELFAIYANRAYRPTVDDK